MDSFKTVLISVVPIIYKKNCKTNHKTYPTLFKTALNYLKVHTSSVPSERAFSSSEEIDTNNQITLTIILWRHFKF